MATVASFRRPSDARNYAAGFCVSRVVVARRRYRRRVQGRIYDLHEFVVCHPSTAKRRGWKVVAS